MAAKLARSRGGGASSSLEAGSVVANKYRIERVLGEGGMGVVYAAHHELLDQRVALKVLFEEATRDREACARFLQEARSAARLNSVHVARVMDIDTLDNGVPYIVMEYLEGADLGLYLERGQFFSPEGIVDFVLQALEAIAQAHAQGIVHRDLKPSNLFVTTAPDGSCVVKVLDFGISKPTLGRVDSLTSSRSVLGSPPYMSPEQVRSPRNVDARSDIWSIGILLYELLTGMMPFDGEEIGELFAAILEQEPRPIRHRRPDVPDGLEGVIQRCLAKKRDERFSDVGELARALAPYGSGQHAKLIERIASTLLRGEELSNPRRYASAADAGAAVGSTLEDPTQPDPPPPDARQLPELPPTSSTVGRHRSSVARRAVRKKVYAFAGGSFAALVVVLVAVFLVERRGPRREEETPEGRLVSLASAITAAPPPPAEQISTPSPPGAQLGAPSGGAPVVATMASGAPHAKPRPRPAPTPSSTSPIVSVPPGVSSAASSAPLKASPVDQDELRRDVRIWTP